MNNLSEEEKKAEVDAQIILKLIEKNQNELEQISKALNKIANALEKVINLEYM